MVSGLRRGGRPSRSEPRPRTVAAAARYLTVGVSAAGIASFALLYAPQPVLPQIADTYALDAGGASLSVSVATAGLAAAVLPIATLSEVVDRRKIIMVSLVASVLLGLALPFAPNYPTLLALRALQGVAIAGFPGVAAAFLTERLGSKGVAGAIGAMVAGNTVGGLAGRLTSGLSTDLLGWRGAMTTSAVLSLICVVVAIFALHRQRFADPQPAAERDSGSVRAGLAEAVRRPVLLAQYAVALLAMGSFVALYNAATFRLTSAPLDLAPSVASLVFLAYAMGVVSSSLAGRLVRRFGRPQTLVVALLVTIGGTAVTLADTLPLVIVGFLVLTGAFFAAHAVSAGWAAAAASPRGRGQASGLYTLAYYVGSSIGGAVGSAVYALSGWPALVVIVSGWLALAAAGIVAVAVAQRRRARRAGSTGPADGDTSRHTGQT